MCFQFPNKLNINSINVALHRRERENDRIKGEETLDSIYFAPAHDCIRRGSSVCVCVCVHDSIFDSLLCHWGNGEGGKKFTFFHFFFSYLPMLRKITTTCVCVLLHAWWFHFPPQCVVRLIPNFHFFRPKSLLYRLLFIFNDFTVRTITGQPG